MGCKTVQIGDNAVIVCSRGRRLLCSVPLCGKVSVALCDYPVERNGKPATCDSPMCTMHRRPVPDKPHEDWCESHFQYEQRKGWKDKP